MRVTYIKPSEERILLEGKLGSPPFQVELRGLYLMIGEAKQLAADLERALDDADRTRSITELPW